MPQSPPHYVSPTLGPTNPWAHQTSTGTFRPPNPPLQSSLHEASGTATAETRAVRSSSFPNAPCAMIIGNPRLQLHSSPQNTALPVEKIMKMIISAVGKERDTFASQKESNRVLEQELKQLQIRREEMQRELRELEFLTGSLELFQKEQHQLLEELRCQ